MFWKFFRRYDPQTSADAAASLNVTELETTVYEAIKSFGRHGCISDDVCAVLPNLRYGSITPRFRKLLEKGLIEATGETRRAVSGRSQRVMRAM
jgi:predicted MarR family transcription regulator